VKLRARSVAHALHALPRSPRHALHSYPRSSTLLVFDGYCGSYMIVITIMCFTLDRWKNMKNQQLCAVLYKKQSQNIKNYRFQSFVNQNRHFLAICNQINRFQYKTITDQLNCIGFAIVSLFNMENAIYIWSGCPSLSSCAM
jgi:hypothetical protein